MSNLSRLATFNKGKLIWLEELTTIDKIVEDDFYLRSIQVKLFNKRPPHLTSFQSFDLTFDIQGIRMESFGYFQL